MRVGRGEEGGEGLVLNYSGPVWRDDLGHRVPSISTDTHKGVELITTILLFILSVDRNTGENR